MPTAPAPRIHPTKATSAAFTGKRRRSTMKTASATASPTSRHRPPAVAAPSLMPAPPSMRFDAPLIATDLALAVGPRRGHPRRFRRRRSRRAPPGAVPDPALAVRHVDHALRADRSLPPPGPARPDLRHQAPAALADRALLPHPAAALHQEASAALRPGGRVHDRR